VPTDPAELIAGVNEALGLEPGPFSRLVAYRNGAAEDPEELAAELLGRLAELVRLVDAMES
jgi:hypothetical protein